MKWMDWFEEISAIARVVTSTLCCTGVLASSTWAQTHQPDPSTRTGDLDRYADGERVKDVGAIDVSGTRFLIGVRSYPWR
jgi:hypothetical protein